MTGDTLPFGVDETHDPALESWVESANDPGCDFPLQNLPYGRFRRTADEPWRIGVAIGDAVLDLQQAGLIEHRDMARLMRADPVERRALRRQVQRALRADGPRRVALRDALQPIAAVELGLPCEIGDYTDFYTSIHHATAVGRLFRPDQPLLPNYTWVPIGYHGRASTIRASGHAFARPHGQVKAAHEAMPRRAASQRLDYELEIGAFVGRGNAMGEPVDIARAEEHLFGIVLFNDWSARDLQAWEYQPLGPFLSKNFASTVSPWIVTMEALAPFRTPLRRPIGTPPPLPYLDGATNREAGAIDLTLEVWLHTAAMRAEGHPPERLSSSNFADSWWTLAQLVAHHTVNGCELRAGDLFGSGTQSGPRPGEAGSLLELTQGGREPLRLSNGETRSFLDDGDTVILRGHCERDGARRIGLGPCVATVLPAREAA